MPKLRKKPKPPSERTFNRLAAEAALGRCPPVKPCVWCGYPIFGGYCCSNCDSDQLHGAPPARGLGE